MSPATKKTDVNELLKWLEQGGEVVVNFTKADGTERSMHCTQKSIPEVERQWGRKQQIIQVHEIIPDDWQWRAFNKDRVNWWYEAT